MQKVGESGDEGRTVRTKLRLAWPNALPVLVNGGIGPRDLVLRENSANDVVTVEIKHELGSFESGTAHG